MKNLLIATIIAIIFATSVLATSEQETAITETGKLVILYRDGTWKYYSANKDKKDECHNLLSREFAEGDLLIVNANEILLSDESNKKEFVLHLYKNTSSDQIILGIVAKENECIDENADIQITFTDMTKIRLGNYLFFNCKGKAAVVFCHTLNNLKQLYELRNKKIKHIGIQYLSNYTKINIKDSISKEIYNVINCLLK